MTETSTPDGPPESFEAPNDTPGDMLAAWKQGASKVLFERTGGGTGPGWQGNFYLGATIQLGFAGEFGGDSLDVVLRKAMDSCGGGRYRWRARTSAGKWHTDEIAFPGAPKPLGGDDPAQAAQAAAVAQAQAAGYGLGGGPPVNPYGYPQQASYGSFERLAAGWNWSAAKQTWFWVDDDGQLAAPPQGVRPPSGSPSGSAFWMGGMNPYVHDAETPAMRAALDRVAKLEAKLEAKSSGGGFDGIMAMLLQGMKSQSDMMVAMHSASASAQAARSAEERADRTAQDAARTALWKEQRSIIDKVLEGKAGAPGGSQDPLRVAVDKAIADRIGTNLFGDGKKNDDEDPKERIGEKVVDGLTELVQFGKKWLDKKDDKKDEKPGAKKENGAARNGHEDDGLDEDTRRWLTLLEVAHQAYEARRSPQGAFDMIFAGCVTAKIDFDSVLLALRSLSAKQLLSLLADQGEPMKTRATPLVAAFSTGDGLAWFDKLLAFCRSTPVSGA